MTTKLPQPVGSVGPTYRVQGLRLGLLLLPTFLLLLCAWRQAEGDVALVWLAIGFQALAGGWILCSLTRDSLPAGSAAASLYLIAFLYLWLADIPQDWFTHLARAILLVVPLVVFALQTLADSGALELRRARLLADRVAARRDWPPDLAACRALPEVKALRAALVLDAGPALSLLDHPRHEVRLAALAALEFRNDWRSGQAELILQMAQRTEKPVLRAAAVATLGNIDDRILVEAVAQFLHDPSPEVRKAAVDALLWDTDRRWSWIRHAVRRFLADPLFSGDGPLVSLGQTLSAEAVKDLTGWCAEKGVLSARSALTLGADYGHFLGEQPDEGLVKTLRATLADPHAPAVLRLELGRVLQHQHELDSPLLEQLLSPANPAPLRLIAAETLLAGEFAAVGTTPVVERPAVPLEFADGPVPLASAGQAKTNGDKRPQALGTAGSAAGDDGNGGLLRRRAIVALRDLARLPNREIGLATADVVQRRLGVDLGLGLGQPLPPVHSRQAADIAHRVMLWAARTSRRPEPSSTSPPPTPHEVIV